MPTSQLKVQDVLARNPRERLDTVVKVYDRSHLAEDLRQFVITDSLAGEFRKFLDAFTESLRARVRGGSGGDGMAVWLWGFFGSGKSHVAKVLGHLLENDVVEPEANRSAIDLFFQHLDDPTLPNALDLKSALTEIRNHAWCKTVPFEIKSKLDQAAPDSVTAACLRSFHESLGLASTVWLARLERKLQAEGRYDDFVRIYEEQNGRPWAEDRREHGFYEEEFTAALAQSLGRPTAAAAAMLTAYQRDHARVSPETLAREVLDYLDRQKATLGNREPHVVFVIDELGQFIGDSADRIHEVQSIIEMAASQGRGRIWFICTSQEALDQVVSRTGLKLSQLGKLDARFDPKIPLTGEDVRRVVQNRLLRKKETARGELDRLYATREGAVHDLANLNLERRLATVSRESFVESYPFLPITIPLVQELFNSMRGFKLSGSERNMIEVARDSLRALADRPLGTVAALDLVFDQVTDELSSSDYLGTSGIRLIREADGRIPNTPVPPSRLLKVLWLIDPKRAAWVPRTSEVLARLLAEDLDTDLGALRTRIEESLEQLQRAGYVGRDEATAQYRYLSEEERGLEEDIIDIIRDYGTGIGVAKREATRILKERVLTRARWGDFKVPFGRSGNSTIPFSLTLDGEPVSSGSEIVIELYSPLASPDMDAIELNNRGHGTKGRTIWWIAAEERSLIEKLKRLKALEEVPQKPRWRNDRSDETVRVLKEKERERTSLETHLAGLLETALKKGTLHYAGDVAELNGNRDLKTVAADFVGAVAAHLYTRFEDRAFNEANIPVYLDPRKTSLDRLDPDLQLFDAAGHLNRGSPLVEAIFDELEHRKDEGEPLDGRSVAEHFGRVPFGWPDALVRLVLAAMFRGGMIHLESPDHAQPIYDLGAPNLERLFTGPQKFRNVKFIPTSGALSPAEVREAKDALIALGETAVPDTPHGLAERIRKVGERMVREAGTVAQRVRDLDLPLPETYKRVQPVVEAVTEQRDPFACVRRFLERRDDWQEIHSFLKSYRDFVDHERDVAYQTYVAMLDYARSWPAVLDGAEGEKVREALEEFDAVVRAREIIPKWKDVQEAAHRVMDRYRSLYRDEQTRTVQAIAGLKQEVESSILFTRLETPRQQAVLAQHFGPRSTLALSDSAALDSPQRLLDASRERKPAELETLRLALPGHRQAIFDRCEREWEEQTRGQPVPTGGNGGDGQARVVRVNVRERLAGKRFEGREEFKRYWDRLGEELAAKIDDHDQVVVD
jgi:hypothetical protein